LNKGQTTVIAYRGTEGLNASDWHQNFRAMAGVEANSPQMIEAKEQMSRVRAKYGRLPAELLGYSRGGTMAQHMGDLNAIKTTTFNPFVGPDQLKSRSNVEHTIFRTTEDPVSSLLAFGRHKTNYKVSAIQPISGMHDPKSMHALKHFMSSGARQPGGIEALTMQGLKQGQELAHFETIDAMRTGVERGKTFTETLDDFNRSSSGARQNVDVSEGKLGPRIHNDSGTVKYWRASGGRFTSEEMSHFRGNPPPPPRVISPEAQAMGISIEPLTPAQVEHVANLPAEARSRFLTKARATMKTTHDQINARVKPHEAVVRSVMPRTSGMAAGLASGFAAHAVMEGIDPEHHLHPVASEATEGAISGAMGAGAVAALGGSAALGPEILAGAAAAVAAAESQKAITRSLIEGGMDTDTAQGVGSMSGGAIGGATAAATGMGAAVASDVLFGTTLGASIGGPVGALLGAGLGVTAGAVIGAVGWLAGRHEPPPPTEQQIIDDGYFQMQDEAQNAGVEAVLTPATPAATASTPAPSHPAVVLGDPRAAAAAASASSYNQARRMNEILYGHHGTISGRTAGTDYTPTPNHAPNMLQIRFGGP